MGTRSTYRIIEKEGKTNRNLVLVYFQYDGYPEGHPLDTAEWLSNGKVVNGYGTTDQLQFNGAGCLAAQFIAKYKNGTGGVYINPMSSRGKSWENYTYDIIVNPNDKTIKMIAYECGKEIVEIFSGSPDEYVKKFKKVKQDA